MMKVAVMVIFSGIFLAKSAPAQEFLITKTEIEQGDVLGIIRAQSASSAFTVLFDGVRRESFSMRNDELALVGIHYKKTPGIYNLTVIENEITVIDTTITVLERFPKEERGSISDPTLARRINAAHKQIAEAYRSSNSLPQFSEPFSVPITPPLIHNQYSDSSGYFGASRSGGRRYHAGVDFQAMDTNRHGKKVQAINDGVVVLVGGFTDTLEGNTIIVDHGYGILSLYMHLGRFLVQKGDIVTQGQDIGVAGNTGLGRFPIHLHLMLKMQKFETVDPMKFLEFWNTYYP